MSVHGAVPCPSAAVGLTPGLNTATSPPFSARNSAMGSTVSRKSYLFTSESVSEGPPDKVCDRVSDEIVDLFFRRGAESGIDHNQIRVACKTMATTNRVVIAGEVRGPALPTEEITSAARNAIAD